MQPRSARNKMMDYLAKRDHSVSEIKLKLKKAKFTDSEIASAIEYGVQNNWLPNSPESNTKLSEKVAESLHRKGKGIHYINQYLAQKGLPEIKNTDELELEKAFRLVKNKFSGKDLTDKAVKAKLGRFLVSRGFEMSIVRKVIFNLRQERD